MQYFSQETGISAGVERGGCWAVYQQRESIKVPRDDETGQETKRASNAIGAPESLIEQPALQDPTFQVNILICTDLSSLTRRCVNKLFSYMMRLRAQILFQTIREKRLLWDFYFTPLHSLKETSPFSQTLPATGQGMQDLQLLYHYCRISESKLARK